MEATLLDKSNHNDLCNGYCIWVTIQSGWRVMMKLFTSCFRQLYCVMAAGFAPGPYKTTWSGELSDNYTATVYVYCNNGRRYCGY